MDYQQTIDFLYTRLPMFQRVGPAAMKYSLDNINQLMEHLGNPHKKIKTIQFGSKKYQQFKDTTPLKLYSNLDHNDNKRKKNYFSRHKINYPKYSPDWFSKKYLWS